jgi:hypothetical protein
VIIVTEVEAKILGIFELCRLSIGVEARGVSCLFLPREGGETSVVKRRGARYRVGKFNEKNPRGPRFSEFLGGSGKTLETTPLRETWLP